jgi:hypothetical protein
MIVAYAPMQNTGSLLMLISGKMSGRAFIDGFTVIDAQGMRAAPTAAGNIVWMFLVLGGDSSPESLPSPSAPRRCSPAASYFESAKRS